MVRGGVLTVELEVVYVFVLMSANTCEDKADLVVKYEAAARFYSDSVSELNRRIGTVTKEEFNRLRDVAMDAETKSRRAKNALDEHIKRHGC